MSNKSLQVLFFCILFSQISMGQSKPYLTSYGSIKTAVFDSSFERALYKGSLDIGKHHLSGLFLLKRISGNSIRIMFSNEIGITFFDFEQKGDDFIVHSCFPSLKKKSLLKLLGNDFRLLLGPETSIIVAKPEKSPDPGLVIFRIKSDRGSFHYSYDKATGKITDIRTSGSIMGKTDLRMSGIDKLPPERISISNPFIRLHISMTLLSN